MGEPIGPYYADGQDWKVHTYCALFSPNVFKKGKQVMGVTKELKRA